MMEACMNHILILFAYIKFLRKTCRPATEIYESSLQASYKLFRSTLIDVKKKKKKKRNDRNLLILLLISRL